MRHSGPCARTCLETSVVRTAAGPTHDLLKHLNVKDLFVNPTFMCRALINGEVPTAIQGPGFRQFFFAKPNDPIGVYPAQGDVQNYAMHVIGSPFLRQLMIAQLRQEFIDDQEKFSSKFSSVSQLFGLAFEALAIPRIATTDLPICCRFWDDSHFDLPLKPIYMDLDKVDLAKLADKDYMLIPPVGFQHIDAIFVSQNATRVMFLQATAAKSHGLQGVSL